MREPWISPEDWELMMVMFTGPDNEFPRYAMMTKTSTHLFELDTHICAKGAATATESEDGAKPAECPGAPGKSFLKSLNETSEWLRKFDDIEEPSGCPACGL